MLEDLFNPQPREPRPVNLSPEPPSLFPIWYRYDDCEYHYGEGEPAIHLRFFAVVAETPACVKVMEQPNSYWSKPRLVLKCEGYFRKRYCYPTKELAWASYRIRKAKQIGYLRSKLFDTEARLALIDSGLLSR